MSLAALNLLAAVNTDMFWVFGPAAVSGAVIGGFMAGGRGFLARTILGPLALVVIGVIGIVLDRGDDSGSECFAQVDRTVDCVDFP